MDIDYEKELGKYTQFYNYSNCNILKSLLRSAKEKDEFVYGYFVDSYNIKYLYEFVKEGKLRHALKFGTLIDVDTYSPYFMGSDSAWYNLFLRTDENGKLCEFSGNKPVNNKGVMHVKDRDYLEELRKYKHFYEQDKSDYLADRDETWGVFADKGEERLLYDFIMTGKLDDRLTFGELTTVDVSMPCFENDNQDEWSWYFLRTDKNCKLLDKFPGNKSDDNTGGKSMSKASETMQTVISMKMLNGLMKNGEQDLGKLMIMQQMMGGEKIKVTDVLKARLINEFSLDKSGELPLEKVMLMQMLDGGEVDISQILAMKMLGSVLDNETNTEDKKQ